MYTLTPVKQTGTSKKVFYYYLLLWQEARYWIRDWGINSKSSFEHFPLYRLKRSKLSVSLFLWVCEYNLPTKPIPDLRHIILKNQCGSNVSICLQLSVPSHLGQVDGLQSQKYTLAATAMAGYDLQLSKAVGDRWYFCSPVLRCSSCRTI